METEKLINQIVLHKTFGKGVIQKIDEKYLEAVFEKNNKVCKFAYPACFHGFLVLEKETLWKEMQDTIEVWKQESGEAQKEALKQKYEKTVQGIMARHQAAEERKLKAAQRTMEHRFHYSNNARKEKKNN